MSGRKHTRSAAPARAGYPAFLAAVLFGASILLPCVAGAEGAPAPAEAPDRLPRQEFSEPVLDSLQTAFEIYEDLRADLAADRMEGLHVDGMRLAGALRMALMGDAELAGRTPAVVGRAALSAEALTEAEDLASARVTFGEVSRHLLLLGSSDPRLAEGWYVFACPMAEGYHKWLQPMETMANPYMGQAMLMCGASSGWPEAAPASDGEALASVKPGKAPSSPEPRGPEPEFKPGIPGLKMVDVRDQKFLWREIEQLQMWERGDRITIAEFRSKAIEKTAHYLGFSGSAADEFRAVASGAVASVRESFRRERAAGSDPSSLEDRFSTDLEAAVQQLTSLFQGEPRQQLFEPDCTKWLLKLAFGPREAEEAEEARQARADDPSRRGDRGDETGVR